MNFFGLYIHWPFCVSKCPYCDFNSHVRESIDEKRWQEALLKEIHYWAHHLPQDYTLRSIFFGGGTPSLMPPTLVEQLIKTARTLWSIDPELEITLEANPNSFDQKRFEGFAQAGVNRLSLGVQSFQERELSFLGRTHTGDQAREAIEAARTLFPRFSFDLIYALPGQTVAGWKRTLEEAMTFAPQHLSCYQLTYEENTPFHTRFKRGELAYPKEDTAVAFYVATERFLRHHGLHAYEVSNYAVPGQECQHNLIYWRTQPYLAIGPGAHGRLWRGRTSQKASAQNILERWAQQNLRAPETWMKAVFERGHGAQSLDYLTPEEIYEEWTLMGLRLKEGLNLSMLTHLTGKSASDWGLDKKIETLKPDGLTRLRKDHLSLSLKGRLMTNRIALSLLS